MFKPKKLAEAISCLLIISTPLVTLADDTKKIETIEVTATKRSVNIQEVQVASK